MPSLAGALNEGLPMIPPLKTDPKYGYYPWWPEDGDAWIHPEDVATARNMIPSERVFRRDGTAGEYVVLTYGDTTLRVKRTLWRKVPWEGFDLGDHVEVRTRGMKNPHRTGFIRAMLWDSHSRQIQYQIDQVDQPIETRFTRDDLKHVETRDDRVELRIEPSGEDVEELL